MAPVNTETDMITYFQAIRENKPGLCLTSSDDSDNMYTNQKLFCLTEIDKKYQDTNVCKYIIVLKGNRTNERYLSYPEDDERHIYAKKYQKYSYEIKNPIVPRCGVCCNPLHCI